DGDGAIAAAQEAVGLARQTHDKHGLQQALRMLAMALWLLRKDLHQADALLAESQALAGEVGDHNAAAIVLLLRGKVALDLGNDVQARKFYEEALTLAMEREIDRNFMLGGCLVDLGILAWRREETTIAAQLTSSGEAMLAPLHSYDATTRLLFGGHIV